MSLKKMYKFPIIYGWIVRYSLIMLCAFMLCLIIYLSTAKADEPITNGVFLIFSIFVFTLCCGIVGKLTLLEIDISEHIVVDYKEWDTISYKDPKTGRYLTAKIVTVHRNLDASGRLIRTYTITDPDVPEFDISYKIIPHDCIIARLNKRGW